MANHAEGEGTSSPQMVEMVVRTLRHEVGDLLQSVYSAVAILQERLPRGQSLERTILTDLRGRAELCKNELDAAHDLVCPIDLNRDWTDLGELATGLASAFSLRWPSHQVLCDVPRPLRVWADAPRLSQVGTMLMLSMYQSARSRIETRGCSADADGTVQWMFRHDGLPANADQLSWLQEPFSTTRQARFGLGLAFARRVIELHGGRIAVEECPQGGLQITLVFPPGPADP